MSHTGTASLSTRAKHLLILAASQTTLVSLFDVCCTISCALRELDGGNICGVESCADIKRPSSRTSSWMPLYGTKCTFRHHVHHHRRSLSYVHGVTHRMAISTGVRSHHDKKLRRAAMEQALKFGDINCHVGMQDIGVASCPVVMSHQSSLTSHSVIEASAKLVATYTDFDTPSDAISVC